MTATEFSALSALRTAAKASPPPPLEQAAFDAARSAIDAALPQGAGALLDAAVKAWQRADRLWDTIRATPAFALGTRPAACRKGCGWCCHQRVGAAAVEVLAMARALRDRPEARTALAAWQAGQPCAFLKDGACSVYRRAAAEMPVAVACGRTPLHGEIRWPARLRPGPVARLPA